jgi:hypothetical protein
MANELDHPGLGFPVTLGFILANAGSGATTDLTLPQAGTGWLVPTGYKFHALHLSGSASAAIDTGGTATLKVIDDGTELVSGPEPVLSNTNQRNQAVKASGVQPIAAGSVLSVSVTTNGTYGPVTLDIDAVLTGILTPA